MMAYLSFEWLKLSKRWMPRIILALLLGLTLVGFWGQASRISGRPDMLLPRGWLAALSFCSFFAPFFWRTRSAGFKCRVVSCSRGDGQRLGSPVY